MAIDSYANLKVALENWSKRTDSLSVLDDFIDLTEADLWTGPAGGEPLRIRDMEARATATASTSDRFLALPDSYLEMRKLRLYSGSNQYDLNFRVPESVNVIPSSGIPTDYTITSQLEFNRIPSSAYTVEMQYYKSLTALSSSNTSNAVLSRFPMVYLYGGLYHLNNWALDEQKAGKYLNLFIAAIRSANKGDKKGRFGPAKAVRIEGSTP